MAQASWNVEFALNSIEFVGDECHIKILSKSGNTYRIQYSDGLAGAPAFQEFENNGTITASGTETTFIDDFTSNTSGGPSPTGARYYRIVY